MQIMLISLMAVVELAGWRVSQESLLRQEDQTTHLDDRRSEKNASTLIPVFINRFSICDRASKLESVSSDIWFTLMNTIAGSRKPNLSSSIVSSHLSPPQLCLGQRNCNEEHTTQADKHSLFTRKHTCTFTHTRTQ